MTYRELISQSEEKAKKEELDLIERKSDFNMQECLHALDGKLINQQQEIMKRKQEVIEAEIDIKNALRAMPLNVQVYLDKKKELKVAKANLEKSVIYYETMSKEREELSALKNELFPIGEVSD